MIRIADPVTTEPEETAETQTKEQQEPEEPVEAPESQETLQRAKAELPEQARKTMEMETEKETERKITEPEP